MSKTHRLTLPAPIHAVALRGEVSMVLVRMKPQPFGELCLWPECDCEKSHCDSLGQVHGVHLPHLIDAPAPYTPGDLIACREPWLYFASYIYKHEMAAESASLYKWKPASRMPLIAVRLWLRVRSVEARRVADVTEEEAREMGYREHANCPASYWLPDDLGQWAWKLKVERTER